MNSRKVCLFLLGSIIFELVVSTNKWGGFTKSRIPAFLEKLTGSGHGVLTFINDKPGRGKQLLSLEMEHGTSCCLRPTQSYHFPVLCKIGVFTWLIHFPTLGFFKSMKISALSFSF